MKEPCGHCLQTWIVSTRPAHPAWWALKPADPHESLWVPVQPVTPMPFHCCPHTPQHVGCGHPEGPKLGHLLWTACTHRAPSAH